MEMSESASDDTCTFVQCGLSSICEDGTTISVVDCVKLSVFGEYLYLYYTGISVSGLHVV